MESMFHDVAVAPAPTHIGRKGELVWRAARQGAWASKEDWERGEWREGSDVYLAGFPGGALYREGWTWPAVRKGSIAQIQPYLEGWADGILIETQGSGGNSGSPVIIQIQSTEREPEHKIIGVFVASSQVDSGVVAPIQAVRETIDHALNLNVIGQQVIYRNGRMHLLPVENDGGGTKWPRLVENRREDYEKIT